MILLVPEQNNINLKQADASAAAAVADANEDRGSCSCLEGNPCLSQYTCKDWAHRFEIARLVREKNRMDDR